MPLPTPIGRQKDVLYLPGSGHTVVLGTAGSGKTTLAVLRAAYLAHPKTANSGRTLLVTYNRSLVAFLQQYAGAELSNVTVENYHKFARGYLNSRRLLGYGTICEGKRRDDLTRNAIQTVQSGRSTSILAKGFEFVAGEIQWIEQHGITSARQYQLEQRPNRDGSTLDHSSCTTIFEVVAAYKAAREAAGKKYDWDDIATAVSAALDVDQTPRRYKHVIIDEGQDFSPEMIRSLAKAVGANGSVTFFGDMAQQIYGRRMSWKAAGLNVSRVWEFKDNYRNTSQIARLGLEISKMPFFRETPDMVQPTAPKADGPPPALVECSSIARELSFARERVSAIAKNQTVAVITRTWALADRVARHLPKGSIRLDHDLSTWQSGPGVYYGTFHGAKGLEFDTVILPFCSQTVLPDAEVVRTLGVAEAEAADGKLLYVGVTRAKTGLIITHTGPRTSLFPNIPGLYQMAKA